MPRNSNRWRHCGTNRHAAQDVAEKKRAVKAQGKKGTDHANRNQKKIKPEKRKIEKNHLGKTVGKMKTQQKNRYEKIKTVGKKETTQ